MRKTKLGRILRIGIGVGLLLLAVVIAAPRAVRHVSIDAVVNARVMVLRSPIEGRIALVPPPVGTRVFGGQLVAEIHNHRINRGVLGELATEAATLEERIQALDRQSHELAAMRKQLEDRVGAYREALQVTLEKERLELEARRGAVQARVIERTLDLRRQATLAELGHQSTARREQATSSRDQALAEVAEIGAAIERVSERLTWTRRGVFLGDGQNDVPYSQQRMDEIALRQQDIAARRTEHHLRAAQIRKQVEVERERLERTALSRHAVSRDGVVWKNFVADGGEVVIGTELVEILDCSDIFLDVTLDESKFEEVRPGAAARVRLVGASRDIAGTVRSVRGSGAVTEDRLLAAKVPPRTDRQSQAIIELDRAALDVGEASYCQVGRAAKVTFDRDLSPGWGWLASMGEAVAAAGELWRRLIG